MKWKNNLLPIIIIFTFSSGLSFLKEINPHGDSSSYIMMIESLMNEGNLKMEERDLQRANKDKYLFEPCGVYLFSDSEGKLHYGMPYLYPLLVEPIFKLGKLKAISVLNGLLLAGCITIGFLFLKKQRIPTFYATSIPIIFFLASSIPAYLFWLHPEMLIFFVSILIFFLIYCRRFPIASFLTGAFFVLRPTIALFLIPCYWIGNKKREIIQSSIFFFIGLLPVLGGSLLFSQGINANLKNKRGLIICDGRRTYHLKNLPKIVQYEPTQFIGLKENNLKLFAKTFFYFFVGRFTGILWYGWPAFIMFIYYLIKYKYLSKEERKFGNSLLIITFISILLLILLRPLNYFGGRDFVGNRYFHLLPAFLLLPGMKYIKKLYLVILFFIPAFLISINIIWGEIYGKTWMERHISHTQKFPLKIMPIEKEQLRYLK